MRIDHSVVQRVDEPRLPARAGSGWRAWPFMALALIALAACAPTPMEPVSEMDNPWHHYVQGMEAIEAENLASAQAKFERALALFENFSPALAGQALTKAMQAQTQEDAEHRQVDIDRALELIDDAGDEARDRSMEFIHHVTAIRVLTLTQPTNWMHDAQRHHQAAKELLALQSANLPYYRDAASADYFMAKAWMPIDFQKAASLLGEVLGAGSGGKWQGEADALYQRLQRIIRASANRTLSGNARQIAVKDAVTRGDVAALLVDELRLDRLFRGPMAVTSQEAARQPEFIPVDVQQHPFRMEIETAMKWRVRGLEPIYDHESRAWLFRADEPLSRKQAAMILEEVLIKLTRDENLATRQVGQESSPYPDVQTSAPWFNAISNVVSRGLMETEISGAFRPDDPIDGAELLLAIFKLRNVMNVQ